MGVFGLLKHCLKSSIGTENDLFREARSRGGIELIIDFRNFIYVAIRFASGYAEDEEQGWTADNVRYLGGEYHVLKNLVTNFCRCLSEHDITPVFFDDGARGCDTEQFKHKMETWKSRNDTAMEKNRCVKDYFQNLGSIDCCRKYQHASWLSHKQVKTTLKHCLPIYGGRFIVCKGEADDVMTKYLIDTPKAFAIVGNDGDFCVMKDCRFIAEENFDWESLLLDPDNMDQCLATVYTPKDVADSLGLASHQELVDVAILAGNDFTKPLLHEIWQQRTELRQVVTWYHKNVHGCTLESCTQLRGRIEQSPALKEAVEYSRKFYNLEDVDRQDGRELLCEETELKKYINKGVENFMLPSVTLCWYSGFHWGSTVLEDLTMPSIDDWTKPLRCFLYSMCTEQTEMTIMSRSNQSSLDKQKVILKHYKWLPHLHEVSRLDDESRWKLFDRIVNYLESPVKHAEKEDIYNGIALHSFFQGYGTKSGFLIHAIHYLITLCHVHNFHIYTWEYVSLLATALYCVSKETDKIRFQPTWKKPTMRCITLGNWYQYIVNVLYKLTRLLQISDNFPEPEEVYQGTYFTSLYMTLKEKGISHDFIDPAVLETLNHMIEENIKLDEETKKEMKKELGFIEDYSSNIDSDADDDEDEEIELDYHHLQSPKALPIEAHKDRILDHINKYRVTCIEGETGSGKSTKVPQFIVQQYEELRKAGIDAHPPCIIVTQPRRIAAKSLASRVARELGTKGGYPMVEYKRGHDHFFSKNTQIFYVTTSYMIELLVHNPRKFNKFTHVILDEIHERNLDADLMSLIVYLLMKTYKQSKVVVMSATLQAKLFVNYFSQNEHESISSKQHLKVDVKSNYKVEEIYLEDLVPLYGGSLSRGAQIQLVKLFCQLKEVSIASMMNASLESFDIAKVRPLAARLIQEKHLSEKEIHEKPRERFVLSKYMEINVPLVQLLASPRETILMFLPGKKDIDELYDLLAQYEHTDGTTAKNWKCAVALFILHSSIPIEEQQQCFNTPGANTCHIILATNIAESSLTLPSVTVIVDFGLRRHLVYDTRKRVQCLQTGWCSQASMAQRKGRSGRVCKGICIRMMTREHFNKQPDFDDPQMRIAPLDKLILQVKYVGKLIAPNQKPSELLLQAVEPPEMDNINAAVKNLADIGALVAADECADVTLLGQIAMHLPLDLQLCRVIFYGCLFGCPCDAVIMAAALQTKDPFTLLSKKILKDQDKFMDSILRSYHCRKSYDSGCYSEPIMYRNMYKAWLKKTAKLIHRDAEETDFRSQASRRVPKQDDIRKLREEFCEKNALMGKRLVVLEGFVADVSQSVLKCLPRLSENYRKLEELISIVPRRGKSKMRIGNADLYGGIQGLYTLNDIFTNDVFLLNTILAAALSPKFVYGSVQQEVEVIKGKTRSGKMVNTSLNLEKDMRNIGMDPTRSVALPYVPKLFLHDDHLVSAMLHDIVRCISLIDQRKKGKTRKFRFENPNNNQLFIEYVLPRVTAEKTDLSDEKYEITSDLHDYVHYPYQFSEAPSRNQFQMDLPSRQAIAKNGGNRMISVSMPQNPYRIDWSLMSSDGRALKEGARSCKAICGWRNPIGFSCDLKKRLHFGVTTTFTKSKNSQLGWADGISLFPVYQDNLFAIAMMLTFTPHQHGVVFRVDTSKMIISEIEMFKYTIPTSVDNPLTLNLLQLINEIRSVISGIFVNMESSVHRQIPDSQLRNIYVRLLHYMDDHKDQAGKNEGVGKSSNRRYKGKVNGKPSNFVSNPFGTLSGLDSVEDDDIGDVEDQEEKEPGNEIPEVDGLYDYNLPSCISLNAFDVKRKGMDDRTGSNWRTVGTEKSPNKMDTTLPFEYLIPYDIGVFNKAYLAQFHGNKEELLQAEIDDSLSEYSSSSLDSDEEEDYISTKSSKNQFLLKETLRSKLLTHLQGQAVPTLLNDLAKDPDIKENVHLINKLTVGSPFQLKEYIKQCGDFIVVGINSKKDVVCLQNVMGKTLQNLTTSKDISEGYILSTIFCGLLDTANKPKEISVLSTLLKKPLKKVKQGNEDTERLVELIRIENDVFELTVCDGIETVLIKQDLYQEIKRVHRSTIKQPEILHPTEAKHSQKHYLRLSTYQMTQINEMLYEHLLKTKNEPIAFEKILEIDEIHAVVFTKEFLSSINDIKSDMYINWRKVFTTLSTAKTWFEVVGNAVRLTDDMYSMNCKRNTQEETENNEPADDWEETFNNNLSRESLNVSSVYETVSGHLLGNSLNIGQTNTELDTQGGKSKGTSKKQKVSFNETEKALIESVSKCCCEYPVLMRVLVQKKEIKQQWKLVKAEGKYNEIESFLSKKFKIIKNKKGDVRVLDIRTMTENNYHRAEVSLKDSILTYFKQNDVTGMTLEDVLVHPDVDSQWKKLTKVKKLNAKKYFKHTEEFKVVKDQEGNDCIISVELHNASPSRQRFDTLRDDESVVESCTGYDDEIESLDELIQKTIDSEGNAALLRDIVMNKDITNAWMREYEDDGDIEIAISTYIEQCELFLFVEDAIGNIWVINPQQESHWEHRVAFDRKLLEICLRQGKSWFKVNDILSNANISDDWMIVKQLFSQKNLVAYLQCFTCLSTFCDINGIHWAKCDPTELRCLESGLNMGYNDPEETIPGARKDPQKERKSVSQQNSGNITEVDKIKNLGIEKDLKNVESKSVSLESKTTVLNVDKAEQKFLLLAQQYLSTLEDQKCLFATLPQNPHVKDAWERFKTSVKPRPMLRDVFERHNQIFTVYRNEKNADVVQLKSTRHVTNVKQSHTPVEDVQEKSDGIHFSVTVTREQSDAEEKLVTAIVSVFDDHETSNMMLKDIGKPDVVEMWKVVKSEGTYDRFLDFIQNDTTNFTTVKENLGDWVIYLNESVSESESTGEESSEVYEESLSDAEEKLLTAIVRVFDDNETSKMMLKDIGKPDVVELWKVVKSEGTYDKFLDFIQDYNDFTTVKERLTGNWVVYLNESESMDEESSEVKEESSSESCSTVDIDAVSTERELNNEIIQVFHTKEVEELTLRDLQVASITEQWTVVKEEGNYCRFIDFLTENDKDFFTYKNNFGEWKIQLKNVVQGKRTLKEMGKKENMYNEEPICKMQTSSKPIKEAFPLQLSETTEPLRKTQSLLTLPTSSAFSLPSDLTVDQVLVEVIKDVFKLNNAATLLLKDVQNPGPVQRQWRKVIQERGYMKFTDYLAADTDNFIVKFSGKNGWIVHLKHSEMKSVSGTSQASALVSNSIGNISTEQKKSVRIDPKAEMMKGYMESNFISAVQELLKSVPEKECLVSLLTRGNNSVNDAWEWCIEHIIPKPNIYDVLCKHKNIFHLYKNDMEEDVVQLLGRRSRSVSSSSGQEYDEKIDLSSATHSKNKPISFKEALLAPSPIAIQNQLRKATSLMSLPTTASAMYDSKVHKELVYIIRDIYKEHKTNVLLLKDVQNPYPVQKQWQKVISQRGKFKFTEYLKGDVENFDVNIDASKGWVVHLKSNQKITPLMQIPTSCSTSFNMSTSQLKSSTRSDKKRNVEKADALTTGYIVGNFISAVQEYLGSLPENKCLLSQLLEGNTNVKNTWIYCIEQIRPTPNLHGILQRYNNILQIYANDYKEIVVQLCSKGRSIKDNLQNRDKVSVSEVKRDSTFDMTSYISEKENVAMNKASLNTGASSNNNKNIQIELKEVRHTGGLKDMHHQSIECQHTKEKDALQNKGKGYGAKIQAVHTENTSPEKQAVLQDNEGKVLKSQFTEKQDFPMSLPNVIDIANSWSKNFQSECENNSTKILDSCDEAESSDTADRPACPPSTHNPHIQNDATSMSVSSSDLTHMSGKSVNEDQQRYQTAIANNLTEDQSTQYPALPLEIAKLTEGSVLPPQHQGQLHQPTIPSAAEVEVMNQHSVVVSLQNLKAAIESFSTLHGIKPIETVTATFGTNFLCNATLNGKTIGEGYGETKEQATHYALYNALIWLQQIFGNKP